MTILGGGAGYQLTANSMANALVLPEERTASFGILQGTFLAGTAVGFAAGGLIGEGLGDAAPFQFTLALLILSTILSSLFLPYIAPTPPEEGKVASGLGSMLKPLLVLRPRLVKGEDGDKGRRYWGATLLAVGTGESS